jgi:hypothetical protein
MTHYEETGLNEAELAQHSSAVRQQLSRNIANPHVFEKYVWAASYQNQRCREMELGEDVLAELTVPEVAIGGTRDGRPRRLPTLDGMW